MRETNAEHYIGLDIGTSTVRCVIGMVDRQVPPRWPPVRACIKSAGKVVPGYPWIPLFVLGFLHSKFFIENQPVDCHLLVFFR